MKTKVKNQLAKLYIRFEDFAIRYKYSLLRKRYDISETFKFNGKNIQMYGDGQIIIGDNTYIGENSALQAVENCKIQIGDFCAISHNIRIYTSSYIADQNFIKNDRLTKSGDVVIGNGVWIGVNVFINPGVTIGENAVIGANSVVINDVPKNCIFAGTPAKLLKIKSNV